VAYITHVPQILPVTGLDDAAEAKWWPINALPPLAFDHVKILRDALAIMN
jgi:8-oxo-dGTP diphosphatase